MNITPERLKQIIKESINEVLHDDEIDFDDDYRDKSNDDMQYMYHDVDDYDMNNVESLTKIVKELQRRIDNNDYKAETQLLDLKNKITNIIDDPKLSDDEREELQHEYDGVLGLIQNAMDIGDVRNPADDSEKMYVHETWDEMVSGGGLMEKVMNEVAPPGMESWIKSRKNAFVDQYGKKKGLSILYAKAWKEFYDKKGNK
jgi:hypothetical protein